MGLRSSASSGVRLAVALALRDCLYFDVLCRPGLADLCRILSSGGYLPVARYAIRSQCTNLHKLASPCACGNHIPDIHS